MAQRPVPLADVKLPTRTEVTQHMRPNLPYRRRCTVCQMPRRKNHTPPLSADSYNGMCPPRFDFRCVRNATDDDLVTVRVSRNYLFRALPTALCDMRGEDVDAAARLTAGLRHCGTSSCMYCCDQETATITMAQPALTTGCTSRKWASAVPEMNADGEPQHRSMLSGLSNTWTTMSAQPWHCWRPGCAASYRAQTRSYGG